MKALSLTVQKLLPRLSFLWTDEQTERRTDRQTDRQGDSYIPPQTSFAGGIKNTQNAAVSYQLFKTIVRFVGGFVT